MERASPRIVTIAAVVGIALLALPLAGLLWQTPWSELVGLLDRRAVWTALRVSMVASFAAVLVAVVLGTPIAILLARTRSRAGRLLRGLVLLPVVMPPVVAGVALLSAFEPGRGAGRLLRAVGVVLPATTAGTIVAVSFVSVPLFILATEGALRAVDPRIEGAAATLGASRWTVLRRVVLPAARGGMIAGAGLTWARALGEFGASVTFAGSVAGRTRTLPLEIYAILESDREAAIALSAVLLAVALVVLVAFGDKAFNGGRLPDQGTAA